MIKIGLIGAGFMGTMHASCYEVLCKSSEIKVCAIADIDNEKANTIAKKIGAEIYVSGEELIENADVDIVDICLPTYLHARYAIKAMKKGKDVFIEKPVCLTREEAQKLLEIQEITGAKVMVGHCIRFWPEYKWLKEIVDNGKYGKIISALFKRVSPKPTWAWENWLHKVECSGSVALDLHIHDVDYVRYIMGEPEDIKSNAVRDIEGVIQEIYTTYSFNNTDAVIMTEGAWDYPQTFPFNMSYKVKFEKATVVFNVESNPSLIVYRNEGEKFTPELEKDFEDKSELSGNISSLGGYYNELKYFTSRVQAGLPIENASLLEGVKSLEIALKEIYLVGGAKI